MAAAAVAGVDGWLLVLAVLIVVVGAATQSAIGVGLGLIAAPLLSLMDEAFIPGAIILVNLPLTIGIAAHEWGHVDHTILRALPTRAAGSLVGAWLISRWGQQAIAIVVGCAVLLAVAASLTGLRFSPSRRNQLIAGAAAGVSGTVAGIGGPPMAITYQHTDPRTLRASLAVFNTISLVTMSIPFLVIAGVTGWREVRLALLLIPGVFVGLGVGRRLITRLPPERIRHVVLAVCACSAVVLLIRQLT